MSSEQIADEASTESKSVIETVEHDDPISDTTNKPEDVRSQSAEEIALLIAKQQQQSLIKSNENIIVSNFMSFFEPLVKNLDANVEALRSSQYELTNQIKSLLNRK